MSTSNRPLSPHLQVYRWQITMTLSILHRISGVFLSIGSLVLAWWLVSVAVGGEYYVFVNSLLAHPFALLLLFGWSAAFFYHLGNGVRHLLWDIGWGFEIPKTYFTGWSVVIFTVAATAVSWYCIWQRLGGAA